MILHAAEVALLIVLVSINVAMLEDLVARIAKLHQRERERLWSQLYS